MHSDAPVLAVILALAVMLVAAKAGGHVAIRLGQPAVLGELVAGVAIGSLHYIGIPWFQGIASDAGVDIIATLGVLILLFEVGLESTVKEMTDVGMPALLVAILGVATPFALGWAASAVMLPDRSPYVHAFLGATLTATSVGITARVLKDLGRSQSREARIILGAAVIDDILGLIILAVVTGLISGVDQGVALSTGAVASIVVRAAVFLVGALGLGMLVAPRAFGLAARLDGSGVMLALAVAFCLFLSYAASLVGLAPIIGAYAAGLVLEQVHFRDFTARGEHPLEELIRPLSTVLVPVFFVLMGMRVDLAAFARTEVLGLAVLLTVAAVAGKQACALGAGSGTDRLSVGIGMMPRGEVGIIFANIGLGLTIAGTRVIDDGIFAAVMIMVMVTTMATPPALKWSLGRARTRARGGA